MAKIEFQDISFEETEDSVRVTLLRIFDSSIAKEDLEAIGVFKIGKQMIDFPGITDKKFANKFMPLLGKALSSLKNRITGNPAHYIHSNSGIPVFGTLYFGIVDRGTNMIEIKPITGCSIDCKFCSVDAGISSKRNDFVVEADYLVDETRRLVEFKQKNKNNENDDIDVFINPHGEPLLYAGIIDLVKGLRSINHIKTISIITNGTLLSRKLVDELVSAGLDQVNLSINTMDVEQAKDLAGSESYDLAHVLEMAQYIAEKKHVSLIIAPVWIKQINDDQIHELIKFSGKIGARIGIQNYLVHKKGRKIARQVDWESFYTQLDKWQEETKVNLKADSHTICSTTKMDSPFHKGDIVKANIVLPGRMRNEILAVAENRVISVLGCNKTTGDIHVRIIRSKDNTFSGEAVKKLVNVQRRNHRLAS
ncbi:radical SAM protein [Candidatus Woesearchaeota archaeon]|nr:radical SAM protein [Candidatus Woesearchaeota archaeon]